MNYKLLKLIGHQFLAEIKDFENFMKVICLGSALILLTLSHPCTQTHADVTYTTWRG